jgi:hypothetical protein
LLRNTITALALAGVLVAGACGGNDNAAGAKADAPAAPTDDESFCDKAKALYDELTAAGSTDPTSPKVQEVFAEARALDAPAEIAADWTAILDTLVAPVVNGEIDVNDPAGTATLTERAAALGAALQRTGTYFETECGFIQP